MKTRIPMWLFAPLASATLAGCGVDLLTSAETTSEALVTAQCDFAGLNAAAEACRTAYDGCVAVEGADVEACRATLHDCLPPPPHRPPPPRPPPGEGPEGDGGMCHGGDGQRPPPPPPPPEGFEGDGGVRPPPPEGFGPHEGRPPRPGGRHPHPDPAAIQACRDALDACLLANPADLTCGETERSCVRAAFDAAFTAACDQAAVDCANDTSEPCTRILARCAEGVAGGAPVCGDAG